MTFTLDAVPEQFADRQQIIVVGFARSGNHWLSRCLADALDSPFLSTQRNTENWEGLDRKGDYIIRQRHWREMHEPNAKYVYIWRDPRDVAVSMMHLWERDSIKQAIEIMAHGIAEDGLPVRENTWQYFMETWFGAAHAETSYELMQQDAAFELMNIITAVTGEDVSILEMDGVAARQSFKKRKVYNPDDVNLRKGIVGDFRNYFGQEDCVSAAGYWNDWLIRLGYENYSDWCDSDRRIIP